VKAPVPYSAKINYTVKYPFNFNDQKIKIRKNCATKYFETPSFSINYSSSPQFYVATGVMSSLYALGLLIVYVYWTQKYETNPLIPAIDLVATGILTIFWFSGACAWAAGVSNVKNFVKPETLIGKTNFCHGTKLGTCTAGSPGKWASLTISLVSNDVLLKTK
jgi:hypothetical protein